MYVCVICVSIQLVPQLKYTDITTVQAVERFGLRLRIGLGVRFALSILVLCYSIVLEFWCTVRVTVRVRVGLGSNC